MSHFNAGQRRRNPGSEFAVELRFRSFRMRLFSSHRLRQLLIPTSLGLLLAACNRGLPSKLDHLPAELSNPALRISGIFADGWVGEKASLDLTQPKGDQVVVIRGTVPAIGASNFRSALELRLDDEALARWDVRPGDFALSAPVPLGEARRRITLRFSNSQQLPAGDGRSVAARLSFIGFQPKSSNVGSPSDIVRGLNLQLGTGWGVLETFRGETFRWVENDAHILVTPDPNGNFVLSMVLEPGPGVDVKPFLLRVLDADGRQVSAEPVRRRERINFILPPQSGQPADFHLHLEGGGKPAPNDPRILNFRVFELEARPWKAAA